MVDGKKKRTIWQMYISKKVREHNLAKPDHKIRSKEMKNRLTKGPEFEAYAKKVRARRAAARRKEQGLPPVEKKKKKKGTRKSKKTEFGTLIEF